MLFSWWIGQKNGCIFYLVTFTELLPPNVGPDRGNVAYCIKCIVRKVEPESIILKKNDLGAWTLYPKKICSFYQFYDCLISNNTYLPIFRCRWNYVCSNTNYNDCSSVLPLRTASNTRRQLRSMESSSPSNGKTKYFLKYLQIYLAGVSILCKFKFSRQILHCVCTPREVFLSDSV